MRFFRTLALATTMAAAFSCGAAAQGTLRIGINEDPDALDPTINRLASGRNPLMAMCDKLFDVNQELQLVPQLATGYDISPDGLELVIKLKPGVKFHDGEPLDAEAVKFNIERHQTMPGTLRRAELAAVDSVEVVDPLTAKFKLKRPQAYLTAIVLAERAGMMVSPKAAKELGDRFGSRPVCAGPYKFVERIPQGRIVVDKFAGYYDPKAQGVDRIEYLPITDSTVRIAALRSGDLQIAERLSPTDLAPLKTDNRVKVVSTPDLGYHAIRLNSNNGPRGAIFKDVRVRQAISYAIDRKAMVQALFDDAYLPGNQFVNPQSTYYDTTHPVPVRDAAKARQLLKEAGVPNLSFTMLVPSERERQEAAQFIQAMLAEAGITMAIETQDNATMLQNAQKGQFDAVFSFWSGRPHPDGNVYAHFTCKGPQNDSKYCNPEMDKILEQARESTSEDERRDLYRKANGIIAVDIPSVIVWHRRTFTGVNAKLTGFVPHPDSTIRIAGVKLQ